VCLSLRDGMVERLPAGGPASQLRLIVVFRPMASVHR
jgi:hypothetical protein